MDKNINLHFIYLLSGDEKIGTRITKTCEFFNQFCFMIKFNSWMWHKSGNWYLWTLSNWFYRPIITTLLFIIFSFFIVWYSVRHNKILRHSKPVLYTFFMCSIHIIFISTITKLSFHYGFKLSVLTFPDGYNNVAFVYINVGVYTPKVKNCGHKLQCRRIIRNTDG